MSNTHHVNSIFILSDFDVGCGENVTASNQEAENIVDEMSNRDEDTPSPSVIDAIQQSIVESSVQSASDAFVPVTLSGYSGVFASTPLPLSDLCLAAIDHPADAFAQEIPSHQSQSTSPPPLAARQHTDETSPRLSYAKVDLSARLVTPDEFRKPLKAAARNNKRKPRRLGRSLIATDTPEKNEIEYNKRAKRKRVTRKAIRKVLQSDSEEDCEIVLNDDSPDEGSWLSDEEDKENIITQKMLMKPLPRLPREGEYVLVEFASKKQLLYYVAKVLEERNDTLELYVSYLRHKKGRFSMPNTPDLAYAKDDNIKLLLPTPVSSGSTVRQQSYLTFSFDLSCINIR